MSKKKVYAVRKGKTTGLFYSWNECQMAVNGYPGAEFKSFLTEEEAKKYLGFEETKENNEEVLNTEECELIAYVDGSFDEKIGKYAFGCVILTPGGQTIKESGNGDNPESLAIRNVAGEMLGAMFAVKWAQKNGYDSIELRYDYEGIEKWATGVWKAKNALTQKYAEYMQRQQNYIKISFRKVKAHSGDYYNEEADKLAKAALTEGKGIPIIKRGEFWFTVDDISQSELDAIIELVKEEIGLEKVAEKRKDIPYGQSITLLSDKKDKVVITHYSSNDKLMMQGKPNQLFSSVIGFVTELVDVEEIPKIFNNTYNVSIDRDEVSMQFQFYMPNAYGKLPPKITRTLHQAVYNLKLDGDMFDGTFLAQPAMRVLEAHLKMVLKENHIIKDYEYIKSNGFDMFEKIGAKFRLKTDCYGDAKQETIKYIGNFYTFYHNNRHPLSHWDDPIGPLDTTKMLDVHGAHDLIKRTLAIIDEYYEMV